MKSRLRYRSLFACSAIATLALAGCSKSSTTEETTATAPAAVSTANISGIVTSSLTSGSGSGSLQRMLERFLLGGIGAGRAVSGSDACESGTFSGAYVGGGGTVVASGTYSNGTFTVPSVPQKKELLLTFTCGDGSTQRCLVKSGDSGVSCNPVADAVISAFETALAKSVTDTAFDGKSIAKVGAAIVQAAQNDGTAMDAFNVAISDCKASATPATCYTNAIEASPFKGAFKLMQTMANGWSVDSLFTLMVDVYGAQIQVDSFIYSDFATKMDTWLGTNFVSEVRSYISEVVTDQLAGGDDYVTSLQCEMHYSKYQSGGTFKYSPVMATIGGISQPSCKNDAALEKNGFSSSQISAIYTALDSDGGHSTPVQLGTTACNTPNGWSDPDYYCAWAPSLTISSKYVEVNRNDPLGEHGGDFYERPRVSMISIFQEVEAALQNPPTPDPDNCMSPGSDGPPTIVDNATCQTWFGGLMAAQKKNFAGLMGLYMYLKNPSAYADSGSGLLSLTQIHQLFAGSSFLNNKLTLFGNNVCGLNITGGGYLPPLVNYSNGIYVEQSGFGCTFGGSSSISSSDAATRAAAAAVPYEADFKMFEQIPSASEIRSFVFGSGYHSDWNPTGQRKFYTSAVKNTGKPIFCKMTDKDTGAPKESQLDAKTQITCLSDVTGLGTPDATTGAMTLPTGYPYVLQPFGYQGDSKGSVFALADAKTGFQVRPGNSGPVLVYQINAGNGSGQCDDNSLNGNVVTAKLNFGWGTETQSQAISAYCMNMTDFAQAGTFMFYNGGQVEIKQVNGDGSSWTWNAQQVGVNDPASTTHTLLPLCYYANGGLSVSTSTGLASGTTNGEITSVANGDAVDLCSSTSHSSATKYYLIMAGMGWQSGTRENLKAHLIGTTSGAQILQWKNWDGTVTEWEDLLVSIKPSTLENAYNGISLAAGCADGSASATCKNVTPVAAASPIMGVQLANQKWNAKFDPYCDDQNGNGYCDCYEAGTSTLKADQSTCSLEDTAAEPTISNPPYHLGAQNADAYAALFTQFGGKAGSDLHWVDEGAGTVFNGMYLNSNQLWFDTSSVFQCQYLAQGETTYRSPQMLNWMDFGASDHSGCPASAGAAVTNAGGPIRMIKPVAAKNTYAISRPNSIIKLINYATKTVGQGISLNADAQVFSFDEALALVSLRSVMPAIGVPVYAPGTTTADSSALLPGNVPAFRQIWLNNGQEQLDISSAVLRGITHPSELSGN